MTIITLLTDFGTTDSYVGELKGVLLNGAPGAILVDLSHGVPPGDVRSAAYILGRTWHLFPSGTVHLAVVDPGWAATAQRSH
jgi:S-adenosylmethionine hydrolase